MRPAHVCSPARPLRCNEILGHFLPAIALLIGILAFVQAWVSGNAAQRTAVEDLQHNNELIMGMIDAYNRSLVATVGKLAQTFDT